MFASSLWFRRLPKLVVRCWLSFYLHVLGQQAVSVSMQVEVCFLILSIGKLHILTGSISVFFIVSQIYCQWWSMQPLSEDKWTSTLDREVLSSSLSTELEEDFDTELARAYGDIFSKSIEKLKDASTMNLCCTTLLIFFI